MKLYKVYILLLIFLSVQILNAEVLRLEGIYKGENLYVMNPFNPSGVGFCIYEVKVNGQTTTDEIQSSAFEIDLSVYNFEIGDKVVIEIFYHSGCKPKVLNPEVIQPESTFKIQSIKIKPSGLLVWSTTNEQGSLPFIIEQYRWNKWIPIGKVQGIGTPGLHTYSFKVKFHSGLNKFRVKQVDYTKVPKYSPIVSFNSNKKPVIFYPGNGATATDTIKFSEATDYEIYDYYGRLKRKGFAKIVDISDLPKGTYFINYDNQTAIFNKK